MQTHDERVRIRAIGVEGGEGCTLNRYYSFGRWRVDANRIPEIHDLDADVEHLLITGRQCEDCSVGSKTGNKRRGCHADEPVEAASGCGSAAAAEGTGAGGRVLRNRAIC